MQKHRISDMLVDIPLCGRCGGELIEKRHDARNPGIPLEILQSVALETAGALTRVEDLANSLMQQALLHISAEETPIDSVPPLPSETPSGSPFQATASPIPPPPPRQAPPQVDFSGTRQRLTDDIRNRVENSQVVDIPNVAAATSASPADDIMERAFERIDKVVGMVQRIQRDSVNTPESLAMRKAASETGMGNRQQLINPPPLLHSHPQTIASPQHPLTQAETRQRHVLLPRQAEAEWTSVSHTEPHVEDVRMEAALSQTLEQTGLAANSVDHGRTLRGVFEIIDDEPRSLLNGQVLACTETRFFGSLDDLIAHLGTTFYDCQVRIDHVIPSEGRTTIFRGLL